MRRFSSALAAFLLGCTGAPRSVYSLTALDFSQRRDELATTSAPSCNGQPCLQVAKGDVLLISAAGSLQTTLGSVGPEGSASWGGSPFVFVNRPAFGLYGRINQSVFLIGREVVIIAPDSGTLEILVNGCTGTPPYTIDCSTSGSFSVSMFTNLKPEVTIASTPELTDNSIVGTDLTSVSASDPWQDTGIELKKGQKVLLSASGTFSAGGYGQLSADGEPGGMNGGAPYLLVNRFAYRLYGRVDQNVIELGAEASFLSPATGRLELAINQVGDATGSLQVSVARGVVPARGLVLADTASWKVSQNFVVDSTGGWTATNLTVNKGDPIFSSATGQLTGSSVAGSAVGPFGEGGVGGTPYLLPNRPRFALFGKVSGQSFLLGGENALLAPAAGTLEVAINNAPGCLVCQSCAGGPSCVPCSLCDVSGSFFASMLVP